MFMDPFRNFASPHLSHQWPRTTAVVSIDSSYLPFIYLTSVLPILSLHTLPLLSPALSQHLHPNPLRNVFNKRLSDLRLRTHCRKLYNYMTITTDIFSSYRPRSLQYSSLLLLYTTHHTLSKCLYSPRFRRILLPWPGIASSQHSLKRFVEGSIDAWLSSHVFFLRTGLFRRGTAPCRSPTIPNILYVNAISLSYPQKNSAVTTGIPAKSRQDFSVAISRDAWSLSRVRYLHTSVYLYCTAPCCSPRLHTILFLNASTFR